MGPIMAIDSYRTNGELVAACARLGYLREDLRTLDPTWGRGTFWDSWRPLDLVAHDLRPDRSPDGIGVDATALPYPDRSFPQVVIDPPYKLNGRPDEVTDDRYGVHEPARWQDRMEIMRAMLREGARVLGSGCLLFKCQDQVCSGKVRWQTIAMVEEAEKLASGLWTG